MKKCEIFSKLKAPCTEIVLRIDGRNFHRISEELKLEKPYDKSLANALAKAGISLCKEFATRFIYIFSDEFNVLLGHVPFAGRIEKLDSVFASFVSSSVTINLIKEGKEIKKPISFDCRVIPLPKNLIHKYFIDRQKEAWRNCLNSYAYWTLRKEMDKKKASKKLKGMKGAEIHDLLFERGINISKVPTWHRRGFAIYKKSITVEGYNPVLNKKVKSKRKKIFIDWDLPKFNKNFFKRFF